MECPHHPIAEPQRDCYACLVRAAVRHPRACQEPECTECGMRDCPQHDPLHYHHDGCPSLCHL